MSAGNTRKSLLTEKARRLAGPFLLLPLSIEKDYSQVIWMSFT